MPTGKRSGLKGHSPNTTFQQRVAAGWSAMTMSRDEVRAAVARRVERTVIQGAFQIRGRRWSCEELWQYTHDKVLVCEPVCHAPAELLVLDMKGNRLRIATPDVALHPLDHLIIVALKGSRHGSTSKGASRCNYGDGSLTPETRRCSSADSA